MIGNTMDLGSLLVHLNMNASKFEKGMANANASLSGFAKKMAGLGKVAAIAAAGIGTAAIKMASDAEEINSKFSVTFSNIQKSATDAMKELDAAYGLNKTEAKSLLAGTGDLLTGFGFTQDAALDLSTQVQKLAVDLASFQNLEGGAQRASDSLTKALLGERESAKLLGIVIRETDVQNQMLIDSQNGLKFANENLAKAYATLQIAQSQSKNAIGDYARTSGSLANQMRELGADTKQMFIDLGTAIMPVGREVVAMLRSMVAATSKWISDNKKSITSFAIETVGAMKKVIAIGNLTINGIIEIGKAISAITASSNAELPSIIDIMQIMQIGFTQIAKTATQVGIAFATGFKLIKSVATGVVKFLADKFSGLFVMISEGLHKLGVGVAGNEIIQKLLPQKAISAAVDSLSNMSMSIGGLSDSMKSFADKSTKSTSEVLEDHRVLMSELDKVYGEKINNILTSSSKITDFFAGTSPHIKTFMDEWAASTQWVNDENKKLANTLEDVGQKANATAEPLAAIPSLWSKISTGFKSGLREVDKLQLAAQGIGSAFGSALESVIFQTESLRDSMKALLDDILKAIVRAAVIAPITQGITAGIGGRTSAGAAIAGGVLSAQGNAFMGGKAIAFAKGGFIDSTAVFPLRGNNVGVVGEAGREAYAPITRLENGDLGVRTTGGTTQNINVNINGVSDYDSFRNNMTSVQREIRRAAGGV